jgi:hypothetical protein
LNTHADKTQENKSQSVANAVSQKQIGHESTFQFVDNRPEAIAQRKLQEMANNSQQVSQLRAFQEIANNSPQAKQAAQMQNSNNSVAQLRLIVEAFGIDFDSSTTVEELNDLAAELLENDWEYEDKGFTKEDIAIVLRDLAGKGENTLSEYELKDKIFATKEVSEEKGNVGDDDFGEVEEIQNGQKVGKRTFPGETYHITVKPKIINAIGKKVLSLLVYQDSNHHNFDFWIGKKGQIYAGINNSGGHEKDTGYILTEENNIIEA